MHADIERAATLTLPVDVTCWALRPPGHGRWAVDLLPVAGSSGAVADGGWWRYLTCRIRSWDVAGWEQTVRAPLDGEVVAGHDGEPDPDRLVPWRDIPAGLLLRPLFRRRLAATMLGNHVIIGGSGSYVLLAHLRQGSVRVASGQAVHAGQEIGLIGSSGNALGPHLHLQAMDAPDPLRAELAPFKIRQFQVLVDGRWQQRDGSQLPPTRSQVRVGPR